MAPAPKKLVQKVEENLSDCQKLIYWKDLNKSGIYFLAPLAVTYVLQNYTVLGLLSYLLMITCILTSIFVAFKQVLTAMQMQKNPNIKAVHPFQHWLEEIPSKLQINQECASKISQNITSTLNRTATNLVKLLLVDSLPRSGLFLLFLYVFRIFFAQFTIIGLFQMVWIAAFTLPMVYRFKQKEIDALLQKIWAPLEPHYQRVLALLEKFQDAQQTKDE